MSTTCNRIAHRLCRLPDCNNKCSSKNILSSPEGERVLSEFDKDHPKNEGLDILTFKCSSNKMFWWKCESGHSSMRPLTSRTLGKRCKLCQIVDGGMTLTFEDSCADKDSIVRMWSSLNVLSPRQVSKTSRRYYYFDCGTCGHLYKTRPGRMQLGSTSCSYCANKKLCKDVDCNVCLDKSAESHEYMSSHWSPDNALTARQVFKQSMQKRVFICGKCSHSFSSGPNHVYAGAGCPYCSNSKLCDSNDCTTCFEKSFASDPKSQYWCDESNEKTPREMLKSSHKKCTFLCRLCDSFFAMTLTNMTQSNSWCKCTVNKTEQILFEWLKKEYGDENVQREVKFDWTRTLTKTGRVSSRRFDFEILGKKVLVECDGGGHFVQIPGWRAPEEVQEIDAWKDERALENGYSVVRICQQTVMLNRRDWKTLLSDNIAETEKRTVVVKLGMAYDVS